MKKTRKTFYLIVGAVLFSISVNVFLIPISIYNGGFVGVAQLLRDLIYQSLSWESRFDIAGILTFLLNIPVFIFAYNRLSKRFVYNSLVVIITQTLALSLIPIPQTPLISDVFVTVVVAAVIGAFGISLAFRGKGSGGGMDIIGIYLSQKKISSVGKVYLVLNSCIYLVCFMLYDFPTAMYSLVYSIIFALVLDRFHDHNIEVSVMVFTKNLRIKQAITKEMRRGVTYWHGFGAYTDSSMDALVTIVSKAEVSELKSLVRKLDPDAFVIITENLKVDGGFEKRLI